MGAAHRRVAHHRERHDVEHVEHDGGEVHTVELTLGLGGLSVMASFPLDVAEELLIELRDEIVRGKEARLAWETDTDPGSGIDEEEGG